MKARDCERKQRFACPFRDCISAVALFESDASARRSSERLVDEPILVGAAVGAAEVIAEEFALPPSSREDDVSTITSLELMRPI